MTLFKNKTLATTFERALLLLALALVTATTSSAHPDAQNESIAEVVLRSELEFQPLNPARGDAAPQAGILWGDINKDAPSGVLLKFADGFTSPPHIHNITYRAVVISGAVHNDDPQAEEMWMGPGSFWTQPAGESHITAGILGKGATAFLEIMEGPYLVQPSDDAFDNGERPINVDANNIVWLGASDVTWVNARGSDNNRQSPKVAFLWGNFKTGEKNGSFLQLPSGTDVTLSGNGAWLRAVVIHGKLGHQISGDSEDQVLETGSYFGSQGSTEHQVSCEADEDCTIYVSTEGRYKVTRSNH